ncbi:APH(6) family putative aminoglycoside O-phosphotransferase [Paracoccus suum]|uniref:APH(6) family putative aminoglycoside O-phosphotransferase n=1 Tax=Paracoccus suum TaxID=2259340 RepID=A0A344PGT6_9RHOB|nr:aminoglycoside phosphotransferase family protein [Paracoccus suum]AXC48591.1 APH(6) family putative aminoglycoside O-phosphotransferase [Paracoccus suum]
MTPPPVSLLSWVDLWHLVQDGEPITTRGAELLPVRWRGAPAMLKLATEEEEKLGGALLEWWQGVGAARLFAAEGDAILMERATGTRSLSHYARNGRDEEATAILCDTVASLHAPRTGPRPELVPLEIWFRELEPAARTHGGLLARSHREAQALLSSQRDIRVLHGDIHHDNVLDFGARGWLAIDPKRVAGDRAFDYANIFTNPDLDDPSIPVSTRPERFASRLDIVIEQSGLGRERLLRWLIAWCGLSAAWFISDDESPALDFAVMEFAIAALDG